LGPSCRHFVYIILPVCWYVFLGVNRKGRQKERNRKKEEPEKIPEPQQPDTEQEVSDVVEEAEPAEEENIYISDQEEEQRGFQPFLSAVKAVGAGGR